ncbi:MAG TPA: tetratricopeptide repeat protein [Candidatus Hydrogenedentes bacterium]|nr:tetratricopeptide repeat protein [Candidatus Hydrogenedentota bacterium]
MRPDVWSAYAFFAQQVGRLPALKADLRATCERLEADGLTPLPHIAAVAKVEREGAETIPEALEMLDKAIEDRIAETSLDTVDKEMSWALDILEEHLDRPSLPSLDHALRALAQLHARIGHFEKALALYPRAVAAAHPDQQTDSICEWARTLLDAGHPEEAVKLLRQRRQFDPEHEDLNETLDQALRAAGGTP